MSRPRGRQGLRDNSSVLSTRVFPGGRTSEKATRGEPGCDPFEGNACAQPVGRGSFRKAQCLPLETWPTCPVEALGGSMTDKAAPTPRDSACTWLRSWVSHTAPGPTARKLTCQQPRTHGRAVHPSPGAEGTRGASWDGRPATPPDTCRLHGGRVTHLCNRSVPRAPRCPGMTQRQCQAPALTLRLPLAVRKAGPQHKLAAGMDGGQE